MRFAQGLWLAGVRWRGPSSEGSVRTFVLCVKVVSQPPSGPGRVRERFDIQNHFSIGLRIRPTP